MEVDALLGALRAHATRPASEFEVPLSRLFMFSFYCDKSSRFMSRETSCELPTRYTNNNIGVSHPCSNSAVMQRASDESRKIAAVPFRPR